MYQATCPCHQACRGRPLCPVSSKSALLAQLSTGIELESRIFSRSPFGENGKHSQIIARNRQNLPHQERHQFVTIETIDTRRLEQSIRLHLFSLRDFWPAF